MVKNWNTSKVIVPSYSEGAVKSNSFSKVSQDRKHGGRVFPLVKFQALLYKNVSTKGVFLETFRKFPEQLRILDFRD